jgi:hypothetical protein
MGRLRRAAVCLGRNGVSQLESSFGADKPARALNDRHLAHIVDMYAWHHSSELIVVWIVIISSTDRTVPEFCAR